MISFPACKINLGLYITRKRDDGYHELETVFYPVPYHDVLEVIEAHDNAFAFTLSGLPVHGDPSDNLCVKAYQMLSADHPLPAVKMHLHKVIPMGAGLGGGSSDGAAALTLLSDLFGLPVSPEAMHGYAKRLGSDCAFFLQNKPVYATGRGELLEPVDLDLSGLILVVIIPRIHVSTREAYSLITPLQPEVSLPDIISKPVTGWRELMRNDFEPVIAAKFPVVAKVKALLYQAGALYASMTGSGSAVYGLFEETPVIDPPGDCDIFTCCL